MDDRNPGDSSADIGRPERTRCPLRALVDRHFAGRIDPDEEGRMRLHLPACASCRHRYDRQLMLARLGRDPLERADRLAIGLGLPPRRAPLAFGRNWSVVGLAAAVAALAFVFARSGLVDDRGQPRAAFSEAEVPGPAIELKRVLADGRTASVSGWVGASERLTFSYANASWRHVAVLAVDDGGQVRWPEGDTSSGTALSAGRIANELPGLLTPSGKHMRIVGLFTRRELSRDQAERLARGESALDPRDGVLVQTTLHVRR